MLRNSTKPQLKETSRAKSIYFMTWRWHFYAGLFVIPFMLMLSVTGLVMLFDDEIELARYETTLKVVRVVPRFTVFPDFWFVLGWNLGGKDGSSLEHVSDLLHLG